MGVRILRAIRARPKNLGGFSVIEHSRDGPTYDGNAVDVTSVVCNANGKLRSWWGLIMAVLILNETGGLFEGERNRVQAHASHSALIWIGALDLHDLAHIHWCPQ
jgi:hypothetical protein